MLRCSFCHKGRDEVRKLIAGPTVYVCDECVGFFNDIMRVDSEPEAGVDVARHVAEAYEEAARVVEAILSDDQGSSYLPQRRQKAVLDAIRAKAKAVVK